MANTLLLKRSSVANKVPTTSDLALGELGLNTNDGKLYLKKDSGTPAIVEVAVKDASGNLGIGTAPSARLHLLATTEQLRAAYDASNYLSVTVGSTGGVTLDAVGSGAGFTFSDAITVSGASGRVYLNTDSGSISLGRIDGSASTPYIDFNAGATAVDYDVRLKVQSPTGTVGAGTLVAETTDLYVVGPSNSAAYIEVSRTAGYVGALQFRSGSSTRWAVQATADSESGSNAGTNFNIRRFSDAGASLGDALTILRSSGYVGIGVSAPSSRLEVSGAITSNTDSNTLGTLSTASGGATLVTAYYATGANLRFLVADTGGTNTERVRIDSAGNVGIGTTSASARLHLVSTTEQLRVGYDASNYLTVTVGSTGIVTLDAVGSGSQFRFSDGVKIFNGTLQTDVSGSIATIGSDAAGSRVEAYYSTGAYLRFRTADSTGTVTDRMRITSNGGVAFGTSATAYGTAGQVLTSAGDAAPTWSNPTTLGTSQATTSGTEEDFTIPAWARQIVITLAGVSFATTAAALRVRLGDAGGIETTGYVGATAKLASTSAYGNLSAGFDMQGQYVVSNTISGRIELTLVDEATFTWACNAVLGESGTAQVWTISGYKALSAALTTVRVTSVAGTTAFDAGTVNVAYH